MNLSKAEVQNKMRNLIIQFNREAKKGNKYGSGADDGKTKWKFFQSMMFLQDKTIPWQARETAGEHEAVGPRGFLGIRFRRRSVPWGIAFHPPSTGQGLYDALDDSLLIKKLCRCSHVNTNLSAFSGSRSGFLSTLNTTDTIPNTFSTTLRARH
ncbi:hypothetical protein J6590_017154 [Homalodisca vitripennis]|nr:hypothetical protein J6590_017154 [Homalodisca vitripennis]